MEEGNLVYVGKKFQPLIQLGSISTVGSKCAPRAAKFGSSRLWTARGGHFEPLNGAVSNLFEPTRPFSRIKGFRVDILVQVWSDLEATPAGKCVWKTATQAVFLRKKMNSNMFVFFFLKKISPPVFNFFNLTRINPIQPPLFTRLFQIGPWFQIFSIKSLIGH